VSPIPLGARELLLVLRARDEASRSVHALTRSMKNLDKDAQEAANKHIERGRALSSIGVGITAVGAAGVIMLTDFAKASIQYTQEAAKTQTQLDKVNGSLADLKKIGIDVGSVVPAKFEEMQSTLYDIFSSMDTNLPGAQHLLTEFSKAAVAGQVDLQDAARGTIGILNAYRLGAGGVNRVNDVMFQLVRKGVGTYAEFATTIGRAVPSAVRAGQSIEDLGGMLAFLTRNGLSAAMASASAGRALDAISNPKVVDRLKDMGVAVKDANGQFRPMSAIMTDLGKKMQGLTAPERAAALQNLFKGAGGTIQARRFFDIAVKGYGQLNTLTSSMHKSAGATQQAYDIMFKQPQSQAQLFANNLQILKVTMGDALLPTINDLLQMGVKMLRWFDDLSPHTKKTIAMTIAITTAFITLAGVVTIVAGGLMILAGAAAALGIGLGTLIGIIAIVVLAIIGIALLAKLIYDHWDGIKKFFKDIWDSVSNWFKNAWDTITNTLTEHWNKISTSATTTFKGIADFFVNIWNAITNFVKTAWDLIVQTVKTALDLAVSIIKIRVALFLLPFIMFFNILKGLWTRFWNTDLGQSLKAAWAILVAYVKNGWNSIVAWTTNFINIVKRNVGNFFTVLINNFLAGWAAIKKIWNDALNAISARVTSIWNTIKTKTSTFFGNIRLAAATGWALIKGIFTTALNNISAVATSILDKIRSKFNDFWGKVEAGFNAGKNAIASIWNKIKAPLAGPVNFIIDWVWNRGIAKAWNTAADMVGLGKNLHAPILSPIKLAEGGQVRGRKGVDKNLALLTDQEFVVNANATRKFLPLLEAINGGQLGGFAKGGLVGKLTGGLGGITNALGGVLGKAKGFLFDTLAHFAGAAFGPIRALISHIPGGGPWGRIVKAIPNKILDNILNWFKKKDAEGALAGGPVGGVPGNVTGNAAIVRQVFASMFGWGSQWPSTYHLLMGESGFRNTAQNPTSSAYGMFQFLNSTWGGVGGHKTSDPRLQAIYGGRYIQSAYGSPANAYAKWRSRSPHWYDQGGYLMPGVRMVGNHTGTRERVLDPDETRRYEAGNGGNIINVYTNEIDPRMHAEMLGWELAHRA
jgi:TP901 family phage tail tape measure protein